jgi:hypothetical protein
MRYFWAQQIWGTYGKFQKQFGNVINFIIFQSRLKPKKYLRVDP